MLTWCFSAMLLVAQDGAKLTPPPKSDGAAQLKERIGKVPTSGSYAFDSTVESEGGFAGPGGPGGGRGEGGGQGGGQGGGRGEGGGRGGRGGPETTTGKVEIGKTAELKRGEMLAYRTGDKLVYQKAGAWEAYVPTDLRGGGGGGPGGAPGGGAGGRGAGGAGGDMAAFRERFVLSALANTPLPHALLTGLDSKMKDVTATQADGKWNFTGTLTDAGADELSGMKAMRERFGNAGGAAPGGAAGGAGAAATGGPPVTASGTASVTFAANGNVEQIVIETKTSSPRGETKRKQTVKFTDWGKAPVEVPKDAAAKLTG